MFPDALIRGKGTSIKAGWMSTGRDSGSLDGGKVLRKFAGNHKRKGFYGCWQGYQKLLHEFMEQRFSVYRSPPRLKLPRLEGDGRVWKILHPVLNARNLWYLNLMDNSLIYSFSRIFGYKEW